MSTPLDKQDLDAAVRHGCSNPHCTHQHVDTLHIAARCHPKAHQEVTYTLNSGVVRVICAECDMLILEIAVADHAAAHISAPAGHRCADCTIDQEPCPACYRKWWQRRHRHAGDDGQSLAE